MPKICNSIFFFFNFKVFSKIKKKKWNQNVLKTFDYTNTKFTVVNILILYSVSRSFRFSLKFMFVNGLFVFVIKSN